MIPILIDCDPGIDDALALFLAAGSPELRLLGVTTVAGNRPVDITAAAAIGEDSDGDGEDAGETGDAGESAED